MMVPIAGVLFALGYVMQAGLINPFINRPEHRQFMLLVAVAIIMVNVLLIDLRAGRAQRADVLCVRQLRARAASSSTPPRSMRAAPRSSSRRRCLRSSASRDIGKAIRACADNYTGALVVGLDVKHLYALTFGLGAACVGAAGCDAGAAHRRDAAARAGLHAARLRHRHHRRARLDAGRAARRRADRPDRGDGRPAVHAVGQKHVRVRDPGAGAAVPPAGHPRESARA